MPRSPAPPVRAATALVALVLTGSPTAGSESGGGLRMDSFVPGLTPDPRARAYVPARRIVWRSTTPAPERAKVLLEPGSGQSTVWARPGCVLRHRDGKGAAICLDFGRELCGGIQLIAGDTPGHRPVRLRVRFGESVSEAMGAPNNDHAVHDGEVSVPWMGTAEVGTTGFRFVRIDIADPGAHVELKEVRAVLRYRDLEYLGSFESSDDRLDRIWRTGAYTVHLNMQGYVWDGIKRDRLVWMGDLHPETMVISTVFGAVDVVPASLDLVRDETPLPGWMNGMSTYSVWWIVNQHDWYLYHGDLAYLRRQREYLLGLLDRIRSHIDSDGREKLPGGFLDWPTSEDRDAVHAGVQALLVIAMEKGARLCDALGEEAAARRARATEERLRRHVPPAGKIKQAHALQALAGLVDASRTNRETLAVDPLRGISTFYGYYVLQARALAGDHVGALEVIRRYWGAMLDLGATTFWEDFDLEWTRGAGRIDELTPEGKIDVHAAYGKYCYRGLRHSLCHGWAGGPTAWLSEHVLGIRPLEPGFRRVRIRPHLGDLEWAKGTMPTPHGLIRVHHRRRADGSIESDIRVPEGVEVVR